MFEVWGRGSDGMMYWGGGRIGGMDVWVIGRVVGIRGK